MLKLLKKFKTDGKTLKYTANLIFLCISCLLISNLLVQLNDDPLIQKIFILIAVGLDIFRQYVVALAKAYWKGFKARSIALWFVYGIHVTVVIIASTGFALSAIEAKTKTVEVYNMEKEAIINNIKSNEGEIKALEPVRNGLKSYSWKYQEVSKRIDNLQKRNSELFLSLKNFSETKINVNKDIYDTLGKVLHLDGEVIKLYMLLVLSLLIELALLVTSWDIKIENNEQPEQPKNETVSIVVPMKNYVITNKSKVLQYIDSLIEEGLNRLNSNEKISNQTGLMVKECQKIRNILQETTINGTPLIYSTPGTSKPNFPKDRIKQVFSEVA